MSPQIWRTARWFLAIGVSLLVVIVAVPLAIDSLSASLVFGEGDESEAGEDPPAESGDEEPDGSPGQVPTGSVTDGDAAPDADFVVRGGVVRQSSSETLEVSDMGDAVVALFPLIEGAPACVALAELELTLEAADATEVVVYASSVHAALGNGDEVDDARLDATPRAIAVTDGTPGRLRWDVTDVYRAWASGELAPPGTPFAIVLAPPVAEAVAQLTFSSSEAGPPDAPALLWEGDPECDGTV